MTIEHRERFRQQQFIDKMVNNGYELFEPTSYNEIVSNFKTKLEIINDIKLTANEFKQVYDKINQGTVFERSTRLLREIDINLDNGNTKVLKLIKKERWCENEFQIAQEVNTEDKSARFDSIIFINGLPLVIMEFKQSIVGIQRGIDQIINYQKKNKFHDLFLYCQIFVVSSFSTTRYFANNNKINKEFIFKWTDDQNYEISNLIDGDRTIYETLLSRCFIAEMIVRYMIQKESDSVNVILRPYQVYATKRILEKVKNNDGGGYIFHTTGSGKTITSFKTCRLLSQDKNIDKVIFLVDRKDLDAQTKSSYQSFEEGSYEGADNSKQLKKLLFNNDNRIIVGTVQKMTNIINKMDEREKQQLRSKRAVIVIDECHRSQSDKTINALREVFEVNNNAQYFGFTGTPIYDENAKDGVTNYKTTKSVFGEELHRYSITNAVEDKNVLQFNISQPTNVAEIESDYLNVERINKFSQYLIDNYDNYNDNRNFNAILATASKEQLKLYYNGIKEYNNSIEESKRIKFTCIFSTNKDDSEEYVDNNTDDEFVKTVIADFNTQFDGNEQPNNIEGFKNKVYDYVRTKKLDLVIVVNMLLTGFDSPLTKTLFVDKPLRYHGLLQSYSRVNRLYPNKLFGNIVTFIDQKENRDQALSLFSAGGSYTDFEIKPYNQLVDEFNLQLALTRSMCKDGDELRTQLRDGNVDQLQASLTEIKELQRQYTFLKLNPKFADEDINITKKELNDLKDVYREVYETLKGRVDVDEDVEVVQLEFDFDISLFDEDFINLEYLLRLTQHAVDNNKPEQAVELVEKSDLSKEFRESTIEAIGKYDQDRNQEIIEYLRSILYEHRDIQVEEYSHQHEIENIELFKQLIDEQEKGNLSFSQAKEYNHIKQQSGLKAKRVFRNQTYEFVEDIIEKYDLDKRMSI